jgi:hypothetical protein
MTSLFKIGFGVLFLGANFALAGTVPGTTAGSFSVGDNGSATYGIALQTPPGAAGFKPQFSLVYDSHAGRGIAGPGWSLDGAPAIRRCPQTIPQDGARTGISLTATDRFCYNNQRLVLESEGAYGAADTKYRTEIESFVRVTAQGTSGTGPASFLVETKTGLRLTFGSTPDAQLVPAATFTEDKSAGLTPRGGSTVLTWYLSQMTDPMGNVISYTYKAGGAGELLLDTVSYAGGKAKVVFSYRADPNPRTMYVAGSKIQYTQLLSGITTYVSRKMEGGATTDVAVKDYRLAYDFVDAKGDTVADKPVGRLGSITECNSDVVASATQCMPATTFEWNYWSKADRKYGLPKKVGAPSAQELAFGGGTFGIEGTFYFRRLVDLNQDGQLDFVATWKDGIYAYIGDGLGGFSSNPTKISDDFSYDQNAWYQRRSFGYNPIYFLPAGVYGSMGLWGFANFPFKPGGGSTTLQSGSYSADWNASLNKFVGPWNAPLNRFDTKYQVLGSSAIAGDTFNVCDIAPNSIDATAARFLVDMNGDGQLDVVRLVPAGIIVSYWNTAIGAFDFPQTIGAGITANAGGGCFGDQRVHPAFMEDMNGDGVPDFVGVGTDDVYVAIFDPVQQKFGASVKQAAGMQGSRALTHGPAAPFFLTDMNGDGYPDLVQLADDGVYVSLWTGAKFLPRARWSTEMSTGNWASAKPWTPRFVVDLDGDGFPDIVGFEDVGVRAMLSDGNGGFSTPFVWSRDFHNNTPDAAGNSYRTVDETPRYLADVDGDGTPDIIGLGDKAMSWAPGAKAPGVRISSITDGLGRRTEISYRPAQPFATDVYATPAQRSAIPKRDAPGPVYVVASTKVSNGLGGQRQSSFKYGERRVHQYRGNLGFAWIESLDQATNIKTRREFYQDHPLIGLQFKQTTSRSSHTLSTVTSPWQQVSLGKAGEYTSNDRYFVFSGTQTEQSYDLSGTAFPKKVTAISYLGANNQWPTTFWGHLTSKTVTYGDQPGSQDIEKTTFTYYDADSAQWLFDRVKTTKVETTRPARTITPVDPGDAAEKTPPSGNTLVVTLQADPATFGYTLTPSANSGRNLWFKNSGSSPLTITGTPTISTGSNLGVAMPPGTNNACIDGTTVSPNGRCRVYVFANTAENIVLSGAVTVKSTGGNVTRNVLASFTGKLSATGGDFGAVMVGEPKDATITVKNTASYAVYNLSTAVQAPYSVVGTNGCDLASLAASGTCTMTVRFTPTAAGTFNGTNYLSVTGQYTQTVIREDDGAVTDNQVLGTSVAYGMSLTGEGTQSNGVLSIITPGDPATFGSTLTPSAASGRNLWFKNTGTAPLTITEAPTISGGGLGAATPPTGNACESGFVLVPNAQCRVYVYSYSAENVALSGAVTVKSTGGNVTRNVTGSFTGKLTATGGDFGAGVVGQPKDATITVRNTANYPIYNLSTAVQAPYSVVGTNNCDVTSLAAGGTCTMTVRFTPTAAGTFNGTSYLSVTGQYKQIAIRNDDNVAYENLLLGTSIAYAQSVTGSATNPTPLLAVSTPGNPISFGSSLTPNAISGRNVWFMNLGNGPLTISSTVYSGNIGIATPTANACYNGAVVAPNGLCRVYVYGDAAEGVLVSGIVTVNSDGGSLSRSVTGSFTGRLSGSGANFGTVGVGGTKDLTYTVTNVANFSIYGLTVAATAPYSVVVDNCTGRTVTAGGNCTLTVRFAPNAAGSYNSAAYLSVRGAYNQTVIRYDDNVPSENPLQGTSVPFGMSLTGVAQ